MISFIEIM